MFTLQWALSSILRKVLCVVLVVVPSHFVLAQHQPAPPFVPSPSTANHHGAVAPLDMPLGDGGTHGARLETPPVAVSQGNSTSARRNTLPLVTSASNANQQGFVRIINYSDHAGVVNIHAIDDSGARFGPVVLSLAENSTVHLNSQDLEQGNATKGLASGVGSGQGNWRLELDTTLNIEPLAYIRTYDGFLTSVHDLVQGVSMRWHVPIFNPGSNLNQRSILRLINTSGIDTEVTIDGLDDNGAPPPGGAVTLSLPGDEARTLSAQELEEGSGEFDGRFGNGTGKWQLFISAGRPIQAMSLLATPTGHITNLSSVTAMDSIQGSAGNDALYGGNGDNVINPGDNLGDYPDSPDGYDIVHGSAGSDTIEYTDSGPGAFQELRYSGLNSDGITATIDGPANAATVEKGSAGTDTIVDIANPLSAAWSPPFGGFHLVGTGSSDVFNLKVDKEQSMRISGEAGNDRFNLESDGDGFFVLLYLSAPNGIDLDLAAGLARNDGFGDIDIINGSVRTVIGSDFSDVMRGGNDFEWFSGRLGNDVIDGGGGANGLTLRSTGEFNTEYGDVEVDLGAGTTTGTLNGRRFSYTISNLRHVSAGPGNDTLRGDDWSGSLNGRGGDDVLIPGNSNRGPSSDLVIGSKGNDRIVYTDSVGDRATQYLDYSGTFSDLEIDGITATIDGSSNRATVDKRASGTDIIVDVVNPLDANHGLYLTGTSLEDVFHLTLEQGQFLSVESGAGDDSFTVESAGSLTIDSGAGDDTINVDSSGWVGFVSGAGDDTFNVMSTGSLRLDFSDAPNGIEIDLGTGIVRDDGFGDTDTFNGYVSGTVYGSNKSDKILGGDDTDFIFGFGGSDDIDGRGGFDWLQFANADTVNIDLSEGTAAGTWNGTAFFYTVSNFEAIQCTDGDDIIKSSERDEAFLGRGGRDTFVFGLGHGRDFIGRFTDGEDRIDLNELGLTNEQVMSVATHRNPSGQFLGGTELDLTSFGGGTIILGEFLLADLDPSDFLL